MAEAKKAAKEAAAAAGKSTRGRKRKLPAAPEPEPKRKREMEGPDLSRDLPSWSSERQVAPVAKMI